ncbi:hypothetical protein F0L74_24900 [Chitinophaga agrisoli]|uniref:Uncharacterized protein n=1 Tax=Chitinophaga agrisoli TaxID=2607653 RepID=A0A5B2VIN4_9BACT|nr:hypothetical protein [Chitinophaga agrisoli]KAA2239443.1 hypothetical protein F0L74_24900 [Chitinophaga agrisoli]
MDRVELFDIAACIANPLLLDDGEGVPGSTGEICTASFLDNERILVGASNEEPMDDENIDTVPQEHIAVWHFKQGRVSNAVKVQGAFGNLIAIDDDYCLDLFRYPKIINLQTGAIEEKMEEFDTGLQASAMVHYLKKEEWPIMAYNRALKILAVKRGYDLELLSI